MRSIFGLDKDTRRAYIAAMFGFLLDAYDLLLILSVLPLIEILFFPTLTGTLGLLATYGALTISLLFRPLGSSLFGHLADRVGRRRILIITVSGFAVFTFLIGILPIYDQVGILAPVLLYVIRALQGTFVGGEYAAGNPFALEFTPQNRRGLVSGLLAAAFDAGVLLSSLVVFVLSSLLPGQEFVNYGWRIAFFTGIIPAALALYVRLSVPESRMWERQRKTLSETTRINVSPWLYVATSLLMAGFLYTYYSTVGFYPTLVANYLHYPLSIVSLVLVVINGALLLAHPGAGALSDLIGRRLGLTLLALISIIAAVPVFIALPSLASSFITLFVTLVLIGALVNSAYGIHAAYVTESYPTLRRGWGYGFSYAIGMIIGAFAPMILVLLGSALHSVFIAVAINAALGLLLIMGVALTRPETKNLSMER